MKHLAQGNSLAAVRNEIASIDCRSAALFTAVREAGADPWAIEARRQAAISAFIRARHEVHADCHPPSPTQN